jgi:hypothetical protein
MMVPAANKHSENGLQSFAGSSAAGRSGEHEPQAPAQAH